MAERSGGNTVCECKCHAAMVHDLRNLHENAPAQHPVRPYVIIACDGTFGGERGAQPTASPVTAMLLSVAD